MISKKLEKTVDKEDYIMLEKIINSLSNRQLREFGRRNYAHDIGEME